MSVMVPKADHSPELLGAVVSDVMSVALIPGASTAGLMVTQAFSKLMEKRIGAAREILLAELGAGNISLPVDQMEEAVATVYRYQRAASEGAARVNLRLMAQAIAGKAQRSALSASKFLHDADAIASLRREEILLLAAMHRIYDMDFETPGGEKKVKTGATAALHKELIPNVFRTEEELNAVAAGLMRIGFVVNNGGFDGGIYVPTSLLARLIAESSFEDAIKKEPSPSR